MPRRRRRKKRPAAPRAPTLSLDQILDWADQHHARTNGWPKRSTGTIPGSLGETWYKVDKALGNGGRGLPRRSSLAQLLEARRGVRNIAHLPRLTIRKILEWADAHHDRTGAWPHKDSGPVEGQPGEDWANVDAALRGGWRGLRKGSSLPRLLDRHRKVVNTRARPPLSEALILTWADEHHRRTGSWPRRDDGAIRGSKGDTWLAVDTALSRERRGLVGKSSLAALLARSRGVPNPAQPLPLTEDLILGWVDAHRQRTGSWPRARNGPVLDAPGETWPAINKALHEGHRTLPGGSSLAELLVRRRGVRNNWHLPPLTERQVLAWARAHQARTGRWPTGGAGPVHEAPEETWEGMDAALRKGRRGLPGGSSLRKLRDGQRRRGEGGSPKGAGRQ
jgi:hypothetical protein